MNISISRLKEGQEEKFFSLYKEIASSDFEGWTKESKDHWFNVDYPLEYWKSLVIENKLPVFVAFDKDKMVGYVVIEGINFGVVYLGWVGVIKSHRKLGIGKKLMLKVEKWSRANGMHKLELETQESELRSYYESLGYEFEGVRKNSWQHLDNFMFGKSLQ